MKTIKLQSGYEMPIIGLGTWRANPGEAEEAVKKALKLGYTHIDTAYVYENQEGIAKAIKNHKRESLFITSKVWRDELRYESLLQQVWEILNELQTEYLDLLLIHWPNKDIPMEETFKALKELVDANKVRSVGVSNFTINHLKEAIKVSKIPISVNQVEFHPYLNQEELLNFCKKNKITITAYCPLVHGEIMKDKTLKSIADKHNKSIAQVALRWLIQKEIIVIPKSTSEEHLKSNLNIFNFELTNEEMKQISGLNKNYRVCNPGFNEF